MKKLLIVDGMAYFYRAYYAIKNISRSDGMATNALYGFIKMLKRSQTDWSPTDIVVAFDGGLPKKRLELLPEYKAQRPSMPDDMRAQLEPLNRFLEISNIASIKIEGQEADDVIASISKKMHDQYDEILVATGDKDMMQMISDNIKMVTVSGSPVKMGEDEVKEKTGVLPTQIVEWLALIGDSADNILGVSGIGPKTASKILNEVGSLMPIESAAEKLTNAKLANKILDSEDIIRRNIELIKLDYSLELEEADTECFKVVGPDYKQLIEFFNEYEFYAFVKELQQPQLELF